MLLKDESGTNEVTYIVGLIALPTAISLCFFLGIPGKYSLISRIGISLGVGITGFVLVLLLIVVYSIIENLYHIVFSRKVCSKDNIKPKSENHSEDIADDAEDMGE